MFNEKNITKLIVLIPIVFIIITVITMVYISISQLNDHFKHDVRLSEKQELHLQKQYIKNQIENIYNYIENKKQESPIRLKERLKSRVYTGYELALNVYNEKKDKISTHELQKEILETLRKVRFGKNGYYFIAHMKSDTEIITKMLPATPKAENVNAYKLKDIDGKYYVQELAKVASTQKEGFVEYKWFKLTKKEQFRKISFVKIFEPYNWFIGYGEYFVDFEKKIKKEAKERLDLYRFGQNGYIWTMDKDYTLLQHPFTKELVGNNLFETFDKKGKNLGKLFKSKALENKDGNFVEYYWNKPNETDISSKIAYVKHIPDWDWIIGTGVYAEDIKLSLEKLKIMKKEEINNTILKSIILSVVILICVIALSLIISKRVTFTFFRYKNSIKDKQNQLEKINSTLEEKVEYKTRELKVLNEELELKIQERLTEIELKDQKIIDQSKMVALGEMIGNIAHQWRQPLSAISTAASGLKIKKEFDSLSDEDLMYFTDGIVKNSQYLSQVIDDFRDYVKGEKLKVQFDVNDSINKALNIFDSSIHNHKLTILTNFEYDIQINNYMNELIQAVVNILNNAKDALKENHSKEEDRIISISTTVNTTTNMVDISIQDSADGIPSDVLIKVFEPYFTTKQSTQGTGLGLYMTYKIIVESMEGNIKVQNDTLVHNDKTYKGANFIISLPLK